MKFHYLTLSEYSRDDDRGLLQAGDGTTCTLNDILFESLTHINDPSAIVWVAWDTPERDGLRSYVDRAEAKRLGLTRGE